MALMELEYVSKALGMQTTCLVILPEREAGIGMQGQAVKKERYPVLWLLHGASDDCSIWLRRTSVERYVESLGLVVVMPQVHLSRYHNMAHGPRYMDFIAQELPEVLGGVFPISTKREDSFIAGLSMGGYGALMLGMAHPERYVAVGCFSAGNLMYAENSSYNSALRPSGHAPVFEAVYGTRDVVPLRGNPAYDLFAMAEAAETAGTPLPRVFHACGTEDVLLDNARMTAEWFGKRPAFDYTYMEGPGGHSWQVWDDLIQTYLDWIQPDLTR